MANHQLLRQGMPYAVIMATAGVATVAVLYDLAILAEILAAVAGLLVVAIPVAGGWRHRQLFSAGWSNWIAIGPAEEHVGIHTVPLGLAVLGSALAVLGHQQMVPVLLSLAAALMALAWLLTGVCLARFLCSLHRFGIPWQKLSGAWFLVPAAMLGASVTTSDVAASTQSAWNLLDCAGAILGWVAYLIVGAGAIWRVYRFGLGGVAQAPWWIAMGCAGFAALALGRAAQWQALGGDPRHFLLGLMALTELLAILLLFPILFLSARFLLLQCRFRNPAAWPPTFSTSVFALSALQSAALLHFPALHELGAVAGWLALVFWIATAAWQSRLFLQQRKHASC